jgi:hypothetical protein
MITFSTCEGAKSCRDFCGGVFIVFFSCAPFQGDVLVSYPYILHLTLYPWTVIGESESRRQLLLPVASSYHWGCLVCTRTSTLRVVDESSVYHRNGIGTSVARPESTTLLSDGVFVFTLPVNTETAEMSIIIIPLIESYARTLAGGTGTLCHSTLLFAVGAR